MKRNNKFYITVSFLLIIVLFLIIFVIYPLVVGIINNSNDLISAKNNILTQETQIKEINKFKENYKIYQPNLEKIDQMFIDPSNPVDFIKFLENYPADFLF